MLRGSSQEFANKKEEKWMKVFISADIEGIATTTHWRETNTAEAAGALHAKQMTREVLAAVEGAFAGGATEVYIKDAHGSGLNIDPAQMPENVVLLRSWSGHPYCMVEGIDHTFDCAMFVGYHSGAGKPGNPLSHTLTGRPAWVKINGRYASEFMIYSWACALEGVPTVLLSGDAMLCEDEQELHPSLLTVPTKSGTGGLTRSYSPEVVVNRIRQTAEQAVRQDLAAAKTQLPDAFEVEIFFKEHGHAERVSYFPGVKREAANIVSFKTDCYFEVLRTLHWIL
jgi:D-amino peptidase